MAVKHLIRWNFASPYAAFLSRIRTSPSSIGSSSSSSPGLTVLTGETGAGKSILVGAVGLLVGGRPPPISCAPARSRDGRRRSSRTARRPRAHRPPRDLGAGRSRAFVDGALVTSAALREMRRRSSICTGSTSIRCCSIRAHLDLLDAFAGLADDAQPRRGRVRDLAARPRRTRTPVDAGEREKARAPSSSRSSSPRSIAAAPQPGEDDELAATRRCWPTRTSCSGSAPRPTRALRGGRRRAAGPRHGLAQGRRARRLDARFASVRGCPRRGEVAARGSRVLPALLRGRHRRPPARLQEVEDRLAAARASEEEARPDLARSSRGRPAGRELDDTRARHRAGGRARRGGRPDRDEARRLRRALSAGGTTAERFAARSRRRSPIWRWPARGARCVSDDRPARPSGPSGARLRRVLHLAESG